MKTKLSIQLSNPVLLIALLAFGLLAGELPGPALAARSLQADRVQKVIIEKGSLASELPGLALWHDYGSFALYQVSGSDLASLSAAAPQGILATSAEMDSILIDAYPFNPMVEKVQLPRELSLEELSGPGLQLIQFVGPIKEEWLESVRASGGTPIHYIANNAYLVWTEEEARSRIGAMVAQGDFLQYSEPYQPYYKLGPGLRERLTEGKEGGEVVPVVIQMVRHPGQGATEERIKSLSRAQFTPWYEVLAFQNMVAGVRIGDLAEIARLPDVTSVALQPERELTDEVQGQILAGAFAPGQAGPSGPGYLAWLAGLGFSQTPSDYPIVDITDDGIGNGTVSSGDSTLHVSGSLANPTRLSYILNCTAEEDGGGPGGHGHINASIAGGYDTRTGAAYNDLEGFNLGLGINPYGRLAGTRVFGENFDTSACGSTDTALIQASYAAGARISSNSWSCTNAECLTTYDASAQAYDVGTRDAVLGQAGNQQLTFIFAAGNVGPNPGTVGSPGNAKNVITVGASESDRPTWSDGCGVGPSGADDAMDIIGFSSRGPAPGSRFKPEVVAPGTHIQGTASTNSAYVGEFVCDQYHPSGQTVFAASSGTSHSTPAIAGVASLYDYWLGKVYGVEAPSPAMLKAYLLAHPTYLNGINANDTLPSNRQGFGMPNLGLAFDDSSRILVDQAVTFNNSGETWNFEGGVVDDSKPVRIVLTYTDQAGAIGASPQVNDLNLMVEVEGQTYLGNRFSGAWSVTGATPDSKNNAEAVFLPAGMSGPLTITVTAFNIAGNGIPNSGDNTDQDFALVCYNCAELQSFTLSVAPAKQAICTLEESQVEYQVSVGSILGYQSPVTLSASGGPAGASLSFAPNPVTPAGTSAFTVEDLSAGLSGTYTLAIQGQSAEATKSVSASLTLDGSEPGAPQLQSPADGGSDLPVRPAFDWQSVSQASSYQIQIATDDQFTNIVHQSSGITGTSYSPPADLQPGQGYYWRVRASNTCGAGSYSATFTFTVAMSPGDCSPGTELEVLYRSGFESGTGGWSHSGPGDTWTLSGDRVHSGSNAFYGRGVSAVSDQYLVTPKITLPVNGSPLSLQFWNYQAIEANPTGSLCYDGAVLETSTDGGVSWTQVDDDKLLTDPYDDLVAGSFDNPLAGRKAWCGNPQDWLNSVVDLNDYAGRTVQFRFRLATDRTTSKEGWYIDDVTVRSCRAPDPNRLYHFLPLVGGPEPPPD